MGKDKLQKEVAFPQSYDRTFFINILSSFIYSNVDFIAFLRETEAQRNRGYFTTAPRLGGMQNKIMPQRFILMENVSNLGIICIHYCNEAFEFPRV